LQNTYTTDATDILSKFFVGSGAVPIRTIHYYKRKNKWVNHRDHVISSVKHTVSGGVNVNYEILIGKPANQLTLYADDNKKDLIVIGNSGMNGLRKFVMGSVSQQVTNQAECPVPVIR